MLIKSNFFSIKKIVLGIEYNGSNYHGWQIQNNVNTIQKFLKNAVEKIAQENIKIYCGGRTDSGVHAIGQVVHFKTSKKRNNLAWTVGVNSFLPNDISVNWSKNVSFDFHSRFSAISREYCYVILNRRCKSGIFNNFVGHYSRPLDEKKMHIAAQSLVGEKDFSSFRSSQCQSYSPFREVKSISVNRFGNYIFINIEANSFLHHMVRNIVGSLLEIGYGKKEILWLSNLLMLKDRNKADSIAKPSGLYLVSIKYPSKYNIPKSNSILFFRKNFFKHF